MPVPLVFVAAPVVGALVGKVVANQIHRDKQLSKDIMAVDDLQPGDILMKCRCGHIMNWTIEVVQTLSLRDTAYVTHGGIVGPNKLLIEMDGGGVTASDLYTKNAKYNYIVFRSQFGMNLGHSIAQVAEQLRQVHAQTGNLGYDIPSLPVAVAPRIEGLGGRAPMRGELLDRYQGIASGRLKYRFYCTEFVAFCCQIAAIRSGFDFRIVFDGPPVLFNPSYMAKCLFSNMRWKREGALIANVRTAGQRNSRR